MFVKKWFSILTFGEPKKYTKLLLWFMFDSIIATIPYGILLLAIYVLLGPIADLHSALDEVVLWKIVGILGIQTIAYLFVRMRSYIMSCCGMAEGMKHARIHMGEHLRRLSLGFFNQRDTGELSTVLLRDFTTIENLSNNFAPQIAVTIVRIVLSFIMLAIFDIRMTLALFITIPCALPFAYLSYKRLFTSSGELMESQQEATGRILEYVEGIQTLKAFHVAGEHFEKLKNAFDRQRVSAVKMETTAAAPLSSIGRMVLNLGIVLTILTGGILTIKLELSPFYFIAFMVMALNIYEPVSILLFYIVDFARTNRAYERIADVYKEKPLPEPQTCGSIPVDTTICMENVTFGYNDKPVLKNVSAIFKQNQITALVGASGSGKSTITRLIARFWDTDSGCISLGGIPMKELSTEELLSQISMVFQDVYLFHDTIANNIKMGKEDATMDEIIDAAKKASCHDFIMSLPDGYDTMVAEGGSTLSGGEKQRISIARALLKNTPIVLLDEATASLDPENEVLIQSAINELVNGKTVIIVAHRLQSIANADQILVLDNGQIKESGTHEELLCKNGIYAGLWAEQNKAGNWSVNG